MSMCVKFGTSPHGSVGCTIGLAPHVFVGAYGADAADALSKAGALAAELKSLVDDHEELQAAFALVPGGATALTAISTAASLYGSGMSARDIAQQVGPVAAGMTRKILSMFGG
jgi:hypothetical protein